jgi:hypothetical protein
MSRSSGSPRLRDGYVEISVGEREVITPKQREVIERMLERYLALLDMIKVIQEPWEPYIASKLDTAKQKACSKLTAQKDPAPEVFEISDQLTPRSSPAARG